MVCCLPCIPFHLSPWKDDWQLSLESKHSDSIHSLRSSQEVTNREVVNQCSNCFLFPSEFRHWGIGLTGLSRRHRHSYVKCCPTYVWTYQITHLLHMKRFYRTEVPFAAKESKGSLKAGFLVSVEDLFSLANIWLFIFLVHFSGPEDIFLLAKPNFLQIARAEKHPKLLIPSKPVPILYWPKWNPLIQGTKADNKRERLLISS